MQQERRLFILCPEGGLTCPVGRGADRMKCLRTTDGELHVLLRDEDAVLVSRRGEGPSESAAIPRDTARMLIEVMPGAELRYFTVAREDWLVRIYQGPLWGFVLGQFTGQGTPSAPRGFALGEEVTGLARFRKIGIAEADPAELVGLSSRRPSAAAL